MKDELNKITNIWKSNNFNDLLGAPNDKKLLYLYAFYHYFYGDTDCILDVSEGIRFSSDFSNLAHGCFEADNLNEKVIDVLSSYYIEEGDDFDIDNVKYTFNQIESLIAQIKIKKAYSITSNDSILREYIAPTEQSKIVIKVLTNYSPEYETKKILLDKLERLIPSYEYISYELIFGDDIKDEISQLTSDKQHVDEATILIDKPNNYLSYDDNAVIVNASALSFKKLYNSYHNSGLFASNLRFFVPNAKVDEGVEQTVRFNGENFWYYNNGIIIICEDFEIVDNKVVLKNFSIINGGQTTTLLGRINFYNNFYVSCKIIKNKYLDNREESVKFVSEVAEASNTQKPIKSEDIIANKPEQRMLKEIMAENGVFVQIKRGDAAAANLKENYPEAWQKTNNGELGQIIYGSIYQKPGTARNSKDKIFSDARKYNLVFKDFSTAKYDVGLLKDLLFLRSYYKKWQKIIAKDDEVDAVKKGLTKNGFYFVSATTILMSKFYYSTSLINKINELGINSEKSLSILSRRTFNHRIFNDDYSNLEKRIYDLFNLIIDRYVIKGFNRLHDDKPDLSYSNFTKVDLNYYRWIIENVFDDFCGDELPSRVSKIMSPLFYIEGENDKASTEELTDDAINNSSLADIENLEVDALNEQLLNELKDYRTRTYKERNIKAYDVFTNIEMANIAKIRPRTTDELYNKGCFKNHPRIKTKQFGNDIVDIVIRVCDNK